MWVLHPPEDDFAARVGWGDDEGALGVVGGDEFAGFVDVGVVHRGAARFAFEHDAVAEGAEDGVDVAVGVHRAADVRRFEAERFERVADGKFEGRWVDAG